MAIPLRQQRPERSAPVASKKAAPELRVISRRRRWPAVFVAIAIVTVIGGMLGAAVFHTQLAQRQITIDQLERSVDEAREQFDSLRRDRAVLRSPSRIAEEAARLGMVRGATSDFVSVDPTALARQVAAGGAVGSETVQILDNADPLDQFRDVKAVSAGQP